MSKKDIIVLPVVILASRNFKWVEFFPEGMREEEESKPHKKYNTLNNALAGHFSYESDGTKLEGGCDCRVNTVLETLGVGNCFY